MHGEVVVYRRSSRLGMDMGMGMGMGMSMYACYIYAWTCTLCIVQTDVLYLLSPSK